MAQLERPIYHRDVAQGGAVGAGRSTAIVLFTDLVGSTELRSRLGEHVAEQLRRDHDALVAGAVEASRGHVVKNLGDGIMATFGGASDAVAAAVAIQQAIGRHNRSSAAPLEVRIGISAGDVVFEEADCFGTPVIEAARLCAAASGGQVLVTEIVRLLAGSGSGHEFTSVGALELKGLLAPVSACEVAWEPLPISFIPLPALLTDIGRIFVGREQDLHLLVQLWKEAVAGERRVALLAGEPGVGKTRLAAELASRTYEQGATVLAGRCDEDMGVPYQPFVEALRYFVDHTPVSDLPERLGRYGGELARLVPELADYGLPAPLQSDPETERYRLFDAVAAWLGAASAEAPLLLVLDDLQWAAKPTLLLLRHVVRSSEARALVLGIYRDTELTHDHPLAELVSDLRRQGGVERLSLSGLDGLGVAAIVEQAAGRTLDQEGFALARAIYEETEGNPFFVREVLRHLAETGAVVYQTGRWTTRVPIAELGIPEGVRDVVGRRLARLSETTNRALRVAAVVGAEFELPLVQTAGSLEEEQLLTALEEASEARLVIEAGRGRCRFSHALVRATLYEGLTAARRVALHRKVAEAIEACHGSALDDYLPALSHHWSRASAPAADTVRAVDYAIRAGDRALAQLAHDEAVAYYRHALELLDGRDGPPDETRRLQVMVSLGEAQRRAGHPEHRRMLLDAARLARAQHDTAALVHAVLSNSRQHFATVFGEVDAEKVEMLEAAIVAAGDQDLATRAMLLATLALELSFTHERVRRLALTDEALALARRLGDPKILARVLLGRFVPRYGPGNLAERSANTAELLTVLDAVPDPTIATQAHILKARVALESGEIDDADRCLDIADRLSMTLGQPALRWSVLYARTGRAILRTDFVAAEHLLAQGREVGRVAGQSERDWVFANQLCCVRLHQARIDDDVLTALNGVRAQVDPAANESFLAVSACELDRHDDARAALDRFFSGPEPFDPYWLTAMSNCAAAAAHLRDTDLAKRLESALSPYAEQPVPLSTLPTPCVVHHLGLLATTLGRYDEAEERFSRALVIHQHLRAPQCVARTRLEWARMLLTRSEPGDGEVAHDLLRQALATARELGLASIEQGAVELLASQ